VTNHRNRWVEHWTKAGVARTLKQDLQYRPRGRTDLGRHRKRWKFWSRNRSL